MADREVNVVPLFFLHAHEQQHQVGAYGKIRCIVGDDEGVEVIAGTAGLQRLKNQTNNVSAQAVHLAVELDAGNTVAEIHQRGSGILLHDAVGFLRDGDRPHPGRDFDRFPVAAG